MKLIFENEIIYLLETNLISYCKHYFSILICWKKLNPVYILLLSLQKNKNLLQIYAHAIGGPHSPSAHAWRSPCPHINMSDARVCKFTFNPYPRLWDTRTSFQNTPLFSPKIPWCRRRGDPRIVLLLVGIQIFLFLRNPCKISWP